MGKTKVMIVDDQYISRQLFEMYIKTSELYETVYSVESAAFADTVVLKHAIDLVLMDILMADGSNGLEAAARIKKNCPDVKNRCRHLHAGGVLAEKSPADRH